MIQVLWRKNATTTEYVIREMQTMAETRPVRRAGQGLRLKTKAPAPGFWRAPGLLRVDARAVWRRSDASTRTGCVATRGGGLRPCCAGESVTSGQTLAACPTL